MPISAQLETQLENYRNKISEATYRYLETFLKKLECSQTPAEKMKIKLKYIRQCSLIDDLLDRYQKEDEDKRKTVIDYYIRSNALQERNWLGLGYYYDVKLETYTQTLYHSAPQANASNEKWEEFLNDKATTQGISVIVEGCIRHINQPYLTSFSKCFGVTLFKYMRLDNEGKAHLSIIKDAPINVIQTKQTPTQSLHTYLLSENNPVVDKETKFCIDFSSVRDGNRKMLKNWLDSLRRNSKIPKSIHIEIEKPFSIVEDTTTQKENEIKELLSDIVHGPLKALKARVNPITDQEVIVNCSFQDILGREKQPQCFYFEFNLDEYCDLIFHYFKKCIPCPKYTNNVSECLSESLEMFSSRRSELSNADMSDDDKKELETVTKIESFLSERLRSISEPPSKKLNEVFSLIDWSKEKIPPDWTYQNIYPRQENKFINDIINIYKYICKKKSLGR